MLPEASSFLQDRSFSPAEALLYLLHPSRRQGSSQVEEQAWSTGLASSQLWSSAIIVLTLIAAACSPSAQPRDSTVEEGLSVDRKRSQRQGLAT